MQKRFCEERPKYDCLAVFPKEVILYILEKLEDDPESVYACISKQLQTQMSSRYLLQFRVTDITKNLSPFPTYETYWRDFGDKVKYELGITRKINTNSITSYT
jgi:hypothetical protein